MYTNDEETTAVRKFQDRITPQEAFKIMYKLTKEDMNKDKGKIHVLNFYGIGGVGKSQLLRHLNKDNLPKLAENPMSVYFDLSIEQDSLAVMESLRNLLEEEYRFQFPLFDIGLYFYAKKTGKSAKAPELKTLIDRSDTLKGILTVLKAIPIVDLATKLALVGRTAVDKINLKINKHKAKLDEVERLLPKELFDYFPVLFAADLNDNLSKAKEPLVIMIDSYEYLVDEMISTGYPLNNDLWIRGPKGLVQKVNNVLWVIAGREKLKWERFDPRWKEAIDSHLLGNLSHDDSVNFFVDAGLQDVVLNEELWNLTKGTPIYLDLCVERYYLLKAQNHNPVLADFGRDGYTLTARFADDLPKQRQNIIFMLSCINQWQDKMIKEIAPKIFNDFCRDEYVLVKNSSYVNQLDKKTYSLHETIREVFYSCCPRNIKSKTEQALCNYYLSLVKKCDFMSEPYLFYTKSLLTYAFKTYKKANAFVTFYRENIHYRLFLLSSIGRRLTADKAVSQFIEACHKSDRKMISAEAYRLESELYYEEGDYSKAREAIEKLINIYTVSLKSKAIELMKRKLFYVDILMALKDYDTAMTELIGVMRNKDKDKSGNIAFDCYPRMINLCCIKEDYDFAEEIAREALYVCELNNLTDKDMETLIIKDGLAKALYYLQKNEEAQIYAKSAYESRNKAFGDGAPYTIKPMFNYAVILNALDNQNPESKRLLENALKYSNDLYGPNHPKTVKIRDSYSAIFGEFRQERPQGKEKKFKVDLF